MRVRRAARGVFPPRGNPGGRARDPPVVALSTPRSLPMLARRLASCLRRSLAAIVLLPLGVTALPAQATPPLAIPRADAVRMAEAFRLARELGDEVWPGWSAAPFAVLLVTPEREFLVGHPAPPAGFAPAGRDTLLGAEVHVRARTFPTGFLATFPIAGPLPVVVIGQAEHTRKSSQAWVLTVLHEHFHQLQFSRPGYYDGLRDLGLARGDTTGMWALQYAFPYDSAAHRERFGAVTEALAGALDTAAYRVRARRIPAAREAIARFREGLAADDARYLDFQLWQEGVARYTEWRLAALAAARFTPSPAMRALPDFQPWSAVRDSVFRAIARGTARARLEVHRREVVYPVGAAMALLLDARDAGWRRQYLERPFAMPALPAR